LELLVTSIVENSRYLRGNKFILECDHQALCPLFQNKFKGAIYDRWLAVLQQYNFEIRYKPASQMQVADALSPVKHAQNTSVLFDVSRRWIIHQRVNTIRRRLDTVFRNVMPQIYTGRLGKRALFGIQF
jgi:hypothetical protein